MSKINLPFFIALFFLSSASSYTGFCQSLELEKLVDLQNEYVPQTQFHSFNYVEPFITFNGYPSNDIYIWNISEQNGRVIEQNHGRGPLEISRIFGVFPKGNLLYLFDQVNLKYLTADLETGKRKEFDYNFDDISSRKLRVQTAINHEGSIVATTVLNTGPFIMDLDLEEETLSYYKFPGVNLQQKYSNPFSKHGSPTAIGDQYIFARKFHSEILVFSIPERKLVQNTMIGDGREPQENIKQVQGQMMMAPPKASVVTLDAVAADGNTIYLLRKGEEGGVTFTTSAIYEYNYMSGELLQTHKLPNEVKAKKIFRADGDLMVYSEEEMMIYRVQGLL